MPAANTGERSAAVRQYLAAHPGATARETMEALAEQGIEISESLVAHVRKKDRQPRVVVVKSEAPTPAPVQPPEVAYIDLIRRARALARDAGGFAKLRALLDVLAEE